MMLFKLITIPISSLILERFGWNSDRYFKACKRDKNCVKKEVRILDISGADANYANLQGSNNYVDIFVVKK